MTKVILNKPCERPQNVKPLLNSEVWNVTPYHTEILKITQELATYCVEQLYTCITLKWGNFKCYATSTPPTNQINSNSKILRLILSFQPKNREPTNMCTLIIYCNISPIITDTMHTRLNSQYVVNSEQVNFPGYSPHPLCCVYCLLYHLFDIHTYTMHKCTSNRSWTGWLATFPQDSEKWHIFVTNSTMSLPTRWSVISTSPLPRNILQVISHTTTVTTRPWITCIWLGWPLRTHALLQFSSVMQWHHFKAAIIWKFLTTFKFLSVDRFVIYTLHLYILIFYPQDPD